MIANDMTRQSKKKGLIRGFFNRFGVYERAKDSFIYDFYWSLADKRIIQDRQMEIEFYRSLLKGFREDDLIFDIGANQGYKVGIFLKLGARVVAVEPDGVCQEILDRKFLKYRLRSKSLVIVPKAASEKSSTETMWIDTPGSAMNTLSKKWAEALKEDDQRFGHSLNFGDWKEVETTTVEQLVAKHGSPFFIKIDVEGHELNVLRGMRRPVPYLSFEVNLPEFKLEGLECIELLGRLDRDGRFNYASDCRQGLILEEWIVKEEMSAVLESCGEKSIEVFWKTPARNG